MSNEIERKFIQTLKNYMELVDLEQAQDDWPLHIGELIGELEALRREAEIDRDICYMCGGEIKESVAQFDASKGRRHVVCPPRHPRLLNASPDPAQP
jgi:hypothetical protein